MNFKKLAALLLALALCLMTGCSSKKLETQIADLEAQIADRDAAIAGFETQIADKDAAITELESKLAEETAAAEDDAAAASDAEAAVAELEAAVADKDAAIADLEAQIADKDAAIADLEAQIADLSHQIEAANYVVEFDGGYVTVDEAMAEYEYVEYMYSMYGYSMDGYEDYIKQDIATTMVEDKIIQLKAAELGLNVPNAEEEAELQAHAEATLQEYITQYRANFETEGLSAEEVDAQTVAFLLENGIDAANLYQQELTFFAAEKLYEHVVADIAVTDEEVKAAYDEKVAADQQAFADAYNYESATMSDSPVYWHPEGYRNVRQVLIKFDSDQEARYDEITDRIADLEAEMEALTTSEDTGDEGVATTDALRSAEEIQADIDAANAELDALFAELQPAADEVAQKFAEGMAIDELIATYGGDPGSINDDGTTNTYVVSADSTAYDQAFTDAAMSVEEIGGLSEPGRGMYGLHIVYYDSDVASGAVDFETVKEDLYYELLEAARADAYDAQISEWVAELNVVYHMENFR